MLVAVFRTLAFCCAKNPAPVKLQHVLMMHDVVLIYFVLNIINKPDPTTEPVLFLKKLRNSYFLYDLRKQLQKIDKKLCTNFFSCKTSHSRKFTTCHFVVSFKLLCGFCV